ncbi:MAG: hypothetical protein JXA10_09825 [Anaerolineae bacterium]|nr:hypothetical protein [Anaerolineae bacterium]
MSDSFKIGIWGTSRAGKTTFLAMLYHTFLSQHDTWSIRAENEARLFVETAFEDIFSGRSFPEKTVRAQQYQYTITHKSTQQTFILEFLDAPGELFEIYYQRKRRNENVVVAQSETEPQLANLSANELFNYLAQCDGLLIFIDPLWESRPHGRLTYAQLLYQLFEDLRLERPDNPPLAAFCLVKVDGVDDLWETRLDQNHACYRHNPAQPVDNCTKHCPVLQHIGWQFMVNHLPGLLPNDHAKCFTLSSIGRFQTEETDWQLNVGLGHAWRRPLSPRPPVINMPIINNELAGDIRDMPVTETLEPRSINRIDKIAPYNLLAPLLWMLDARLYDNGNPNTIV